MTSLEMIQEEEAKVERQDGDDGDDGDDKGVAALRDAGAAAEQLATPRSQRVTRCNCNFQPARPDLFELSL